MTATPLYCLRCGIPHHGECKRPENENECQCCDGSGCACCDGGGCEYRPLTPPSRTILEQLDAARDGKEFAQVINNLFGILEKAKDDDDV